MMKRPQRGVPWIYVAFACAGVLAGCYEPQSERLSCDDVSPASNADFSQLQALVQDQDKGCLSSDCHNAKTQEQGIRLDTADLVYDEFSHRPDKFYAVLASGIMPDEGTRWTDDDLKLFRSWYCSGAFRP
jgi:uncharacterized membrane protein